LEKQAPKPRFIPQTDFEEINLEEMIKKIKEEYEVKTIIVNPWTFKKLEEMGLIQSSR